MVISSASQKHWHGQMVIIIYII